MQQVDTASSVLSCIVPAMTPLTYTVEQAAEALQIGRSAAYEAVRRGEIPSVRIGRSVRIPRHQLEAMLDSPQNDDPGRGAEVVQEREAAPHATG
jgi:excisionase family DNA binding protein